MTLLATMVMGSIVLLRGMLVSINKPGKWAFQITENASEWGCENIGVVLFVDPVERE